MGRRYRVMFPNITVSAAQDLLQIKGATGKMVKILRHWLGATNQSPTNQQLQLRSRFLPATVTDGTGGGTPTIEKTDPGDPAASFTALRNNTGKATTSGTAIVTYEDGCNVFAGNNWDYATPPPIGPSESFVLELVAAPTGTLALSGGVEVEETGG